MTNIYRPSNHILTPPGYTSLRVFLMSFSDVFTNVYCGPDAASTLVKQRTCRNYMHGQASKILLRMSSGCCLRSLCRFGIRLRLIIFLLFLLRHRLLLLLGFWFLLFFFLRFPFLLGFNFRLFWSIQCWWEQVEETVQRQLTSATLSFWCILSEGSQIPLSLLPRRRSGWCAIVNCGMR